MDLGSSNLPYYVYNSVFLKYWKEFVKVYSICKYFIIKALANI